MVTRRRAPSCTRMPLSPPTWLNGKLLVDGVFVEVTSFRYSQRNIYFPENDRLFQMVDK